MSNGRDRRPSLSQVTAASVIAIAACGSASDALASRPSAERVSEERELSHRVARIVERIRLTEPALQRDLPPAAKVAQWRN